MLIPTPKAHAQTGVVADVPFEFSVNNRQLAPGTYQIRILPNRSLVLQNLATGRTQFLSTQPEWRDDPSINGRLIFRRYEGHYYLSQVSIPGRSGYRLSPSRSEREMLAAHLPSSGIDVAVAIKTPIP
jgi:hypothetical protein